MILIAASIKDNASLNIKKQILDHYQFKETTENFQANTIYTTEVNGKTVKLVTLNDHSIYAQGLADFFPKSQLIVFVSKHSSVRGIPTLSVHTPGNLGEARMGGILRKVSISPANAMRDVLKAMMHFKEEMQLDYEVSYECTHHGPSLNVPTMFAELGSSPKQWNDSEAAEAVAHATMEAIYKFGGLPAKAVLGVGGLHYNNKFTRIAVESEIAFGHMIPKHAIPDLDVEILEQCLEKTLEHVEFAMLDWKGIKGKYKQRLVEMLNELDVLFQKV